MKDYLYLRKSCKYSENFCLAGKVSSVVLLFGVHFTDKSNLNLNHFRGLRMTWDFPCLSRDTNLTAPSTSSCIPHLLPCWGPDTRTSLSPTSSPFHLGEILTLFSFLKFVPSHYCHKERAILIASAWPNFAPLSSSQDVSRGPSPGSARRQCLAFGHLAGTFPHPPPAEQGAMSVFIPCSRWLRLRRVWSLSGCKLVK